ncbi:Copper chaperone [Handroanthus impetiginosus]|uniref:Copper chaperone n=1 Tax=Handroanthus impetiginosus TaxID=429701 RepID=A0A2G9G3U1_9LAMI|nr:Copper chaperone [Handroanthus impetiginosus]
MQKVVLKLEVHDAKGKRKAMKAVSSLTEINSLKLLCNSGIESLAMDMNEKKLTVIGNVDPVQIVHKLRKSWYTEILSVGPAKEPEKKEDGAKDDGKKDDDPTKELLELCKKYYPHYTEYYCVHSCEENPNSCVIC